MIEIYVLDTDFTAIYLLDKYESLLWTDRYYSCGSFEIYTPVTKEILDNVKPNYYLWFKQSEKMMIVEDFTIETNFEDGNHIKIVGRSLESILDRRIVWKETTITGTLQNGIKKIINENIISPTTATGGNDRKITNFVFKDSTDTRVTALKVDNQYTGDNILDIVEDLCQSNKLGYRVTLDEFNRFVFELYMGTDRSYNQSTVPQVVFKPSFGNMLNSNYVENNSVYKNVALVAGEGEGTSRDTRVVGSGTGINRREMYVDARDVRREDSETVKDYNKALDQRGTKNLKDAKIHKEFDGKLDVTQSYVYGKDFFIGDTLQIANEYGIESPSMVTEFTWSVTSSGTEAYPTFLSIEDGIKTDTEDPETGGTGKYLERKITLSTTSSVSCGFTSDLIKDDSVIDIYTNIYGVNPSQVTRSGNYIEITFPKYATASQLTVRIYIKN